MKEDRKCRKCGEPLTKDETVVISGEGVYHTDCFISLGKGNETRKNNAGDGL